MLAVTAMTLLAAASGGGEAPPRGADRGIRTHEVAPGETLSGIARRYYVTPAAVAAANRLPATGATLRPGSRLVIPPPAGEAARAASRAPSVGRGAPAAAAKARSKAGAPDAGPPEGMVQAVPDLDDVAYAFAWPIEGPITSTFGRRRQGWHRGLDIRAEPGVLVLAAAAGQVIASGAEPRYGLVVKLEHAGGFVTVYAHNTENLVTVGAVIPAGEPVATIGRTGRATSEHLHFEIRRFGRVYNPLYLLPLPPRLAQIDESEASDEGHE
jgi:murein DD-endopeptidase MepM/ murein hydrolase activator NlpD